MAILSISKKVAFSPVNIECGVCIDNTKPVEHDDETMARILQRRKWEQDDYICKAHICNAMSDAFFDQYHNVATTKEIWDSLEAKYMVEDATSKKFLASKFFDYKMVDSKRVVERFYEIKHILNQFSQHKMNMDESAIVSVIINKLPPSWKYYKRSLKHKKKEDVTLEELDQYLGIEEEYRINFVDEQVNSSSKVHMVEEGKEAKQVPQHSKDKKQKFDSTKNQSSKKKGSCHHCGKSGHFKRECYLLKKKKKENTSNFIAMISEINSLEDDTAWWID
ncbi:hypothetical protein LWI28_022705 [Acer negundo]|uniref:CCHC-type domain-containing protein n=1 Tax=Acer negundo TaxID=4023 RepID=A0AAD5NVC4_ACENE|nr:hypothetical protein LWI28_022705 [Acer negundo]